MTLINQFYYGLLRYIRERDTAFYTFVFPLILATLYFLTTSSLIEGKIEPINVGVSEEVASLSYATILSDIDVLAVQPMDPAEGNQALVYEQIEAYVDSQGKLLITKVTTRTDIVKEILDQVNHAALLGPAAAAMDYNKNFVKSNSTPASYIVLMFFGLIGMSSLYGGYLGLQISTEMIAPLSPLASRLSSSPLKRFAYIAINCVLALLLNLFANTLLIAYIQFILKVEVVTNLPLTLVLLIMSNIFGVLLGMLIGLLPKFDITSKTQFFVAFTIVATFISGGMIFEVKNYMSQLSPWINRLNPVNILTENMYRINLLGDGSVLGEGITILSSYGIVFLVFSYSYLRGKRYDSI